MRLALGALMGAALASVAAANMIFDLSYLHNGFYDLPAAKRGDAFLSHINTYMERRIDRFNETRRQRHHRMREVSVQDSVSSLTVHAYIGSQEQPVPMLVDSGSTALFVKDQFYQPNKSETASSPIGTFSQAFLSGTSASGPVYMDTVRIGDLSAEEFPVGVVTPDLYKFTNNDEVGGIIGLSFPGTPGMETKGYHHEDFITALRNQGQVDERSFQFKLGKQGKLVIGGSDDSLAEDGLFELDNGGEIKSHCGVMARVNDGEEIHLLFDTGMSGIVTTPDTARELFSNMHGVEVRVNTRGDVHGVFDCKNAPNLNFSISNTDMDVEISEDTLSMAEIGHGKCMMPVVGMVDAKEGLLRDIESSYLVGEAFLQHVTWYCNYDDTSKMKIGKAKHDNDE